MKKEMKIAGQKLFAVLVDFEEEQKYNTTVYFVQS